MSLLRIYITFDVDPDYANATSGRTHITWRGIEAIPALHAVLSERGMLYTFFVRCDNQIRDLYGSYTALYETHQTLWERLRAAGNEFGWHPHLYERQGSTYVPLRRPDICCNILREAWEAVKTLPFEVHCVRLGEAWHSTETMREIDALGLRIDSTAVPGRLRNDASRSFDWEPTPNRPYHPSRYDYRIASTADPLSVLEVPMTTAPIQTEYDKAPLCRYLNLTYHTHLFRAGLERHVRQLDDGACHDIVLTFHPDEVLPHQPHGLYAYDWECFQKNLDVLLHCLQVSGHEFMFCCLREVLQ